MIGRPKKEKKPLCVLSLRKEKIIEIIGSRWYMPVMLGTGYTKPDHRESIAT